MEKISHAISKALLFVIRAYRYWLSPLIGHGCRFHPSCSSFAIEAIQTLGCTRGSFLTLKRILRCHPWSEGGHDPVPEP